jgi:hypothetical protein
VAGIGRLDGCLRAYEVVMNTVLGWNEIGILLYLAIPGRCQSLHAWSPPFPSPNIILVAYYQ